ncbi:dnaJ homolog subfamily B member 14 [Galendromus occidentalis]|uniref:DnaJ homolog subfamily B member 14 n=1 Tax=Galendromus occidentalis TaxID=34638 RepID=A0AAJ6QT63_9ACAR|nr:dnaJ homolog subfamily B member 14 [Galendromus occidentalis]
MESNRDDALQAIIVAKKALAEGNIDKAKKFLNKSLRICPTDQAKELLDSIESGASGSSRSAPGSPKKQNGDVRNRKRVPSPDRTPECSPEHLEVVKRISKCKNYYEVLEVDKENFNENELKKKYRKLALLVHPDKNLAPGAADAFKKVGNAYGVLSDHQKKAEYDINMNRPVESGRSRSHNEYAHFETSADITPDELFNVFFNNTFGGGTFTFDSQRRRRQAYHRQHFQTHEQSDGSQSSVLLQMLPILVLVGVSVLSSFFAQDPPYSMLRTTKYPVPMQTTRLNVPFFVQESFHRDFNRHAISRIQEQIEADYIVSLRHNCIRERQSRDSLLWRARHTGNHDWETKAHKLGVPSCDRLNEIHGQA